MMQFLAEYGLFLAKSVTLVAAILFVATGLASLLRGTRHQNKERLQIKNINERLRGLADALNQELLDEAERKRIRKARKKEEKQRARSRGSAGSGRPRMFVLDFDGDLQASAVARLREEISAVLQVARDSDEVLLRLESAGGLVHAYGLAASQLRRIRDRRLRFTVCVDKVAASGGYMMACVAERILAAPFAIVGSIGVVAQLPNFNRLLRKHDIDVELHTAGDFKRTLTVFGENTEAGRAKFREEMEQTHALFKGFVAENRPVVDIGAVATGEHWFGSQALALKLVDELRTSDDYLLARAAEADVYEVRYRHRQKLGERLARGLGHLAAGLGRRGWAG